MNALKDRAALCALVVGCLLNLSLLAGTARSQSDLVFTTSDISPSHASRLTRFDLGSETFSVTSGASSLFQGVSVLNGEVLVADYGTEAIQRFAPDGTHLGAFAAFTNPIYLETDAIGNVYANSGGLGGSVATRFNSAGAPTQTFTHASLGSLLAGMDADADGNVYIANHPPLSTNLFKFAADGTFLNSISLGSINPSDLAIDEASDLLYLADSSSLGNGIVIVDISGAVPSLVGTMATPGDAIIEGMHFAAESGNILATDYGIFSSDPRGLEYSPSGVLLQEYRTTDAEFTFDITTLVVPEPSSLALLALGMLMWWRGARR